MEREPADHAHEGIRLMGFPYSDGLYGRGLYSRRPDWWRDKTCVNDQWSAVVCDHSGWEKAPHVEHHRWQRPRQGQPIAGGANGRR